MAIAMVHKIKILLIAVLLLPLPLKAKSDHNITLAASVGVPDLLNLQFAFIRLPWLKFGFGMATQPVTSIIENFADLDEDSLSQEINETYTLKPSWSLSMQSYNSFIRLFPGTTSFYLQAKYSTWNINARASASVIHKQTKEASSIGSVSFTIVQPMVGGHIGYFALFSNSFFIDTGLGAMHLLKPSTNYSLGGIAGNALTLSVLDPDLHKQVTEAKNEIDKQIDSNIRSLRSTVPYIPSLYFTIGWAF